LLIGVPKELKDNEYRVGLTPSGVGALIEKGHEVIIETTAGEGSGFSDEAFKKAGASIIRSGSEVYIAAEMIVKVKEPIQREYPFLKFGQIVFTFFHLAADRAIFEAAKRSAITAVAYETIEDENGKVPILEPMSEVAGRLSVQIGSNYLLKQLGGRGVLLSGVPGVKKGRVLIIGAGTVGQNALKVAVGLGAEVTVMDLDIDRFRHIDELYGGEVETLVSNPENIEKALLNTDLLIGAVHLAGARTPNIVTRDMVKTMKEGSVIVDVSVDQGGCVETTKPTTHSEPTFTEYGVLHYGVTNMPGSVPRTSTFALTNATLPYVIKLADLGLKGATEDDPAIARGVNAHMSKVTNKAVAESYECELTPLESLL
jgi:alanine dehydrogenase